MAEIPAPTLIGVQRVVVDCDVDSTLSETERRTICEQLVKKAQRVTSLPVSVAAPNDVVSGDLERLSEQLLLRVKVSAASVDQARKNLTMTVTPVRLAMPQGEMAGTTSSASLVKVQDDWVVQGNVDAFAKLLGGGPPKLHTPIVAEE
jgi:hypothetical protein